MGRRPKFCSDRVFIPADYGYEIATIKCNKLRDHPDSHYYLESNGGKEYAIVWENKTILNKNDN